MRDVDFSPDGSYFVIVDDRRTEHRHPLRHGRSVEDHRAGARRSQPTWVDATGGDTLTAVAITGSVVYVGGHQRWMNNYSGRDYRGTRARSLGPGSPPSTP